MTLTRCRVCHFWTEDNAVQCILDRCMPGTYQRRYMMMSHEAANVCQRANECVLFFVRQKHNRHNRSHRLQKTWNNRLCWKGHSAREGIRVTRRTMAPPSCFRSIFLELNPGKKLCSHPLTPLATGVTQHK